MIKYLISIFFFAWYVGVLDCHGQKNYALIPVQPQNYTLHYDDLWRLNIVSPLGYYFLQIKIYGQKDKLIWKAKTYTFAIKESPHTITPDQLEQYEPLKVEFTTENWHEKVMEGGGQFPSGKYRIVYRLIKTTKGCTTTGELVAKTSYKIHVKSLYPPTPLSPYDEDTLFGQPVVFSWAPPFTVLPDQDISYMLRLVEVMKNQNPMQAITNNPTLYRSDEMTTTQLTYPSDARTLSAGDTYAWQVTALNSDHTIAHSSVWSFTISKDDKSAPIQSKNAFFLSLSNSKKETYYSISKNILYFKYKEKYHGFDDQLQYTIQNLSTNDEVISGKLSPLSVHEGYNTYALDISGLAYTKFLLIIRNEKGEKYYLRFYRKQNK